MLNKRSPSILPRFSGIAGRNNLIQAICSQKIVANNEQLAKRLIRVGTLHEFLTDRIIVRQGDPDNDVYLIIYGSVCVIVNQREVAIRHCSEHVGEMALLDRTARRSATIRAMEKTVMLKISEPQITTIAKDYPDFWRRIAIEIGSRLRERTKFIREPNPVPILFIGSSSEALAEAEAMDAFFEKRKISCRLWSQGFFGLSHTTIEDLMKATRECDFAVIFLTPDDLTASRGRKLASPRDNVVFELGLFMGAIGRERTYLAVPKGVKLKLPTDLLGVTHGPYQPGTRFAAKRLRPVLKAIFQKIKLLGPK